LADSLFEPLARATAAERLVALKGTALAVFEPAISGRVPLGGLWLERWRELRPQVDAFTHQLMTTVLKSMRVHAGRLAEEGANGAALRDQLHDRLDELFRAAAGTLVATLCHLVLMALDFERLRGGLVSRALFARGR
jgi:hypothetical protein